MTIENLKQIAIKYATTKGSRVPLAPDELCNAVVQYFNEFLKITADINTIQVAVTEEGGNIVFTITGNTLDGKAFTPIVITVDHNDFVTNQEFEEFKTSVTKQLNNKRSVISSPASSYVVYTQANGLESNLPYSELANQTSTNIMARRANGTSDVKKGISGENVANMENIADVEAKIPDVTNLATKDELNNKLDKSNWEATVYIVDSNRIQNNVAYTSNPSPNTFVYRDDNSNFVVNSPTENGNPTPKSYVDNALAGKLDAAGNNTFTGENTFNNSIYAKNGVVAGDTTNYGANSVTKGSNTYSFPNKSGIFALTSDVPNSDTLPKLEDDNTYTGTNTFNNVIYAKNGIVAGDTTNYGANSVTKGSNTYSFPNKSGTFAMTTDVIKDPIYFISFYATEPTDPCHLRGIMMSKNSYGTGQKTNEEFAVMLSDNLYTNSDEGLAAPGKFAEKDILCIYSDDGLSIRYLDANNDNYELPTIMFFVMETEL